MANIRKHIRTATNIETVQTMLEDNKSHRAIAEALGISTQTLRRHYRDRLDMWIAKVGHPEYKRTDALALLVRDMRVLGHNNEEIGAAVGCKLDTLLKYYQIELDMGAIIADIDALHSTEKFMHLGSAAHAKMYWDLIRGRATNTKSDLTSSDGTMTPVEVTRTVIEVDKSMMDVDDNDDED